VSVTLDDVQAAIVSWRLTGIVSAKPYGGKVELTVDGESRLYPAWLALQQVNLLGVDRGL
jgi:hypothetical protein